MLTLTHLSERTRLSLLTALAVDNAILALGRWSLPGESGSNPAIFVPERSDVPLWRGHSQTAIAVIKAGLATWRGHNASYTSYALTAHGKACFDRLRSGETELAKEIRAGLNMAGGLVAEPLRSLTPADQADQDIPGQLLSMLLEADGAPLTISRIARRFRSRGLHIPSHHIHRHVAELRLRGHEIKSTCGRSPGMRYVGRA